MFQKVARNSTLSVLQLPALKITLKSRITHDVRISTYAQFILKRLTTYYTYTVFLGMSAVRKTKRSRASESR